MRKEDAMLVVAPTIAMIKARMANSVMYAEEIPAVMLDCVDKYDSLDRDYHGLSHLVFGFQELHRLEKYLVDPANANLIWAFHDYFCAAGCPANEKFSGDAYAAAARKIGMKASRIAVGKATIQSTKSHVIPGDFPGDRHDVAIIHDVDLAPLGIPHDEFVAGGVAVEAEFGGQITPEEYIEKRGLFAGAYLGRDRIYKTSHFRHLEEQAQKNLRWAVEVAEAA